MNMRRVAHVWFMNQVAFTFICITSAIMPILGLNMLKDFKKSFEDFFGSENASVQGQIDRGLNQGSQWWTHPVLYDASFEHNDLESDTRSFEQEWGSYRPGVYFGLKQIKTATRTYAQPPLSNARKSADLLLAVPMSVVTGILWGTCSSQREGGISRVGLRHDTAQGQLKKLEWSEHDGKSYGKQVLHDDEAKLALTTSFATFDGAKNEDQEVDATTETVLNTPIIASSASDLIWTQRVDVRPLRLAESKGDSGATSVLVYMGVEVPHARSGSQAAVQSQSQVYEKMQNLLVFERVALSPTGRTAVVLGRGRDIGEFKLTVHVYPVGNETTAAESMDLMICKNTSAGTSAPPHCQLSISFAGTHHVDASSGSKQLQQEFAQLPAQAAVLSASRADPAVDSSARRPISLKSKHESEEDENRAQIRRGRRMQTEAGTGVFFTAKGEAVGSLSNGVQAGSSFLALQVRAPNGLPFRVDAVFTHIVPGILHSKQMCFSPEEECATEQQDSPVLLTAEQELEAITYRQRELDMIFRQRSLAFQKRFENIYQVPASGPRALSSLAQPSSSKEAASAGRAALSSLLGGLGHFVGVPLVGDASVEGTEYYDEVAKPTVALADTHAGLMVPEHIELLSCSPSRTVFPRGFLWDEGFHQLVVVQWAPRTTMRVLQSWLQAMYVYSADKGQGTHGGWIPREMILGK